MSLESSDSCILGSRRERNITGDLRVSSRSGGISGTAIDRVRDAHSTSGAIDLAGTFSNDAQIASTSGSVALRFGRASAVHIDASTISDDVSAAGLPMAGLVTGPHSVSRDLGAGKPAISVHTTSDSIRLLSGI